MFNERFYNNVHHASMPKVYRRLHVLYNLNIRQHF